MAEEKNTVSRLESKDIQRLWPGAFKKSTANRDGVLIDAWFTADSERGRYPMDTETDFYQWDTEQDAWYFGTWCCPERLQVVQYVEGDIKIITCRDGLTYQQVLAEFADAYGKNGLDDYDGLHWEKVKI
jgi:hypothetical protein